MRWRCFIEEYSPNLIYLNGKLNVIADTFSCLPRFDSCEAMDGKITVESAPSEPINAYSSLEEPDLYLPKLDGYFETMTSLLNLPSSDDIPISYLWL